jgi:hypothetical protein
MIIFSASVFCLPCDFTFSLRISDSSCTCCLRLFVPCSFIYWIATSRHLPIYLSTSCLNSWSIFDCFHEGKKGDVICVNGVVVVWLLTK